MSRHAQLWSRRRFSAVTLAAGIVVPGGLLAASSLHAQQKPLQRPATGGGGDVFAMLAQEHRQVEQLFQQLLKTGKDDAQQRSDLLKQLDRALTLHGLQEENVVYPALRQADLESQANELFAEHADIKTYLFRLTTMQKGTDTWLDTVRDFQEEVQSHVKDEEDNVFPNFREKLPAEQLSQITQMVQQVKQQWG